VIRRRLVALILAVVALVTAASGVLIVRTLESRLVASLDRELVSRSSAVAPPPGRGPGRRPPPPRQGDEDSPFEVRRYAFVERDPDGRVVTAVPSGPADDPDPLPDVTHLTAPAGPLTVGSGGGGRPQFRVVAVSVPDGGTLVTGLSLDDVDRSVRTAREIVTVAGVLAVAAAGLIVWFTVRRSLRPIDQMVPTAERIAAGDLSERAPVPQPASEVGHLGTALNTMLDRIEEAVDAKTASEARTAASRRTRRTSCARP
jgi:two-component system OmpR family sensor kinase